MYHGDTNKLIHIIDATATDRLYDYFPQPKSWQSIRRQNFKWQKQYASYSRSSVSIHEIHLLLYQVKTSFNIQDKKCALNQLHSIELNIHTPVEVMELEYIMENSIMY